MPGGSAADSSSSAGGGPGEWVDIFCDGKIEKKVLTSGTGAAAEYNHRAFFRYSGKLRDTEEVVEGPREASTVLGSGECVPALELGLKGMVEGEVALVRCDSRFAYGELARPGAIPANASMIFEVELLRTQAKKENMTFADRIEFVTYKKEVGGLILF